MGLFTVFILLLEKWVTTGARKKPIEYMFCFICSEQCIKNQDGLICSVFKKSIPYNTTPTFQEVDGVTQSLIFCRWHENFSG